MHTTSDTITSDAITPDADGSGTIDLTGNGTYLRERGADTAEAPLSDRERDVLRLASEGFDTLEIARRLSYSERTVKNVIHGVMTRNGLRNRTQTVAHAIRQGWI